MASLGDEDPTGEDTGDVSLMGQSPIKEMLVFSKQDEARLTGPAGSTSRVVVVQTLQVTPSITEMEVTEEQDQTSKSTTLMKLPLPCTSTPDVTTYRDPHDASVNLQGTPIASTSMAEDAIVISDDSSEWKDSSESTAKAPKGTELLKRQLRMLRKPQTKQSVKLRRPRKLRKQKKL